MRESSTSQLTLIHLGWGQNMHLLHQPECACAGSERVGHHASSGACMYVVEGEDGLEEQELQRIAAEQAEWRDHVVVEDTTFYTLSLIHISEPTRPY